MVQLVSESVKTKQVQSFLLSEKQALARQLQQINALVESAKLRILHAEEQAKLLYAMQTNFQLSFFLYQLLIILQMKACLTEALRYNSEDRHLAVNLETTKWELADAEKELKWLKSAVTSSDKEYEQIQRKTEDMRKELENERWVVFLMLV